MAIDLYQPFTNPITRETFRCISSTEEAYTMEWTVHPGGYVPFEHVHMNQDEIFHVEQGSIHAMINGRQSVGKVGDVVIVPCGMKHIACNKSAEKLVCIVEYKPGLDHFKTMQCFAGLTLDQYIDNKGLVSVPKIMYLLKKTGARSLARPAFAPELIFRFAMNIFFVFGTMAGWEKFQQRYTG